MITPGSRVVVPPMSCYITVRAIPGSTSMIAVYKGDARITNYPYNPYEIHDHTAIFSRKLAVIKIVTIPNEEDLHLINILSIQNTL